MRRETLHIPLHEATCLHHAGSLGVRPGAAGAPRCHGHRPGGIRRTRLLLADPVLRPGRCHGHSRRPHPRRRRARDGRGRVHPGGAGAGIPGDAARVPGRRIPVRGLISGRRVSSERMIDPLERWRQYGEKPDYAGLLTFSGMPYTQDPAELAGFDVAVIGAPTDDLVSDRPGARFGPRAIRAASCPPGPHLESKVDAFEELRIVDFGDAAVLPADAARSHAAIEQLVGQVLDAGVFPVVLGGDHSIAEPDIRATAERHGPVGLVHFDTHTDTGREVFGVEVSHGTPMFRLVEARKVAPQRYVQVGLRGYWPGEREFAWQAEHGITSFFMHDVRELGIAAVVARTLELVGEGPAYLTVDVDVLDPAFAPGTGTPEPGGMTSGDLLWACREVARRLELVGAEVVEVIPTAVGSADVTALVADRIVREILNGLSLARRERRG